MNESRTAKAIKLWDNDPNLSVYKAALIAGITHQALYQALEKRERRAQADRCPTCGAVKVTAK